MRAFQGAQKQRVTWYYQECPGTGFQNIPMRFTNMLQNYALGKAYLKRHSYESICITKIQEIVLSQ